MVLEGNSDQLEQTYTKDEISQIIKVIQIEQAAALIAKNNTKIGSINNTTKVNNQVSNIINININQKDSGQVVASAQ